MLQTFKSTTKLSNEVLNIYTSFRSLNS